MKKISLTLLLFLLIISGCTKPKTSSSTCYDCGFNTVWTWTLNENDKQYDQHIKNSIIKYHQLFDIYNDYKGINNLKTINDEAGNKPVIVDEAIIELLSLAKEVYELSNHYFDICQGNLLNIWHNYRDEGKKLNVQGQLAINPPFDELASAYCENAFDHLIIDTENNSVYLNDPSVTLDVGGIAKGFAVEKISEELNDLGVRNYGISGGGNIKVTPKANHQAWRIAIGDPRNNARISYDPIIAVNINKTMSIVTSGDYFNYYIGENKQKFHHIINPKTLYPENYYHSVTVILENSALADAISTSLFNMPITEAEKFIQKINTKYNYDVAVLWILNENNQDIDYQEKNGLKLYMNDAFKALLK